MQVLLLRRSEYSLTRQHTPNSVTSITGIDGISRGAVGQAFEQNALAAVALPVMPAILANQVLLSCPDAAGVKSELAQPTADQTPGKVPVP